MFSVEHASSMGPAAMGGEGEQQASCLVAKQAMEFAQVLARLVEVLIFLAKAIV